MNVTRADAEYESLKGQPRRFAYEYACEYAYDSAYDSACDSACSSACDPDQEPAMGAEETMDGDFGGRF